MEVAEARLRVTVKVIVEPSLAEALSTVAVGGPSVLVIVPTAVLVVEFAVRARLKVRSGVKIPSLIEATVTVFEVSPAAKVSVPDLAV